MLSHHVWDTKFLIKINHWKQFYKINSVTDAFVLGKMWHREVKYHTQGWADFKLLKFGGFWNLPLNLYQTYTLRKESKVTSKVTLKWSNQDMTCKIRNSLSSPGIGQAAEASPFSLLSTNKGSREICSKQSSSKTLTSTYKKNAF